MKIERKITKVNLKKGLILTAEYTETQPGGVTAAHKFISRNEDLHQDLIARFRALGTHLTALTGQYDGTGKLTETVVCRGYSIRGDDDTEGVTLTGLRKLPVGDLIVLNTPFRKWNDHTKYPDMDELHTAVCEAERECMEYIFNNKRAADPQGDLFAQQEEDEDPEDDDATPFDLD